MKKRFMKERRKWIQTFSDELKKHPVRALLLILYKLCILGLGLASPLLFKIVIDQVMVGQQLHYLFVVCWGYIIIFTSESLILACQLVTGNALTNLLSLRLRKRIWRQYMHIPLSQYDKLNTGDLKNRIDQDVDAVNRFIKSYLLDYGYHWMFVVTSGSMLFYFSWKLALFAMLMVPLSFWMTRWLGKGMKRTDENYRNVFGRYEGWLQQSLSGWKEIKASGMEKRNSLHFTSYWHDLSKSFFMRHVYWFGNRNFRSFKDFFITKMNIYFVGGLLIIQGEMTIGSLLVFMIYYELFFTHMGNINDLDMQFAGDTPSLERIASMMYTEKNLDKRNCRIVLPLKLGQIDFKGVTFQYPDSLDSALKEISVSIMPGMKTAIVGRSGSGKSTFIKLLLNIQTPQEGTISLEGISISDISPLQYHRLIGVVMQDPIVFNMTVRDNIALAYPNATDEDIKEACRMVHLDHVIEALPQQYDTLIGEKGVKLSGGQKTAYYWHRTDNSMFSN